MSTEVISKETTKINLRPVPSARMTSAGYDDETRVMVINFTDHREVFHDVPRRVYDEFIDTLQRGWLIAARMKDNYRHKILK